MDELGLSIVVPLHNEAENVLPLIRELVGVLRGVTTYEILGVDDGSTDATAARLAEAAHEYPKVRILRHARNYGKSAAIYTGARFARARWVATMDGDGQSDPADLLRCFEYVRDPGRSPRLELIAGWRQVRRDSRVKRIASRIANAVRSRVLHDRVPDSACGLKVIAREVFLALPAFDHMHRFLPALVLRHGGEVVSIPVADRPRLHGRSHYGIGDRLWTGIEDLLGVRWLARRGLRPEATEITRTEP